MESGRARVDLENKGEDWILLKEGEIVKVS